MWHFTAKKSLVAILGDKLFGDVFYWPSTAPVVPTTLSEADVFLSVCVCVCVIRD